jgi:hypothetical protein
VWPTSSSGCAPNPTNTEAIRETRPRPRVALVLAAVAALAAARPLLPMRLPQGLFGWGPGYGDWSTVARHLAPVLLLALLSLPVLRRHLRARAWWWLLVRSPR